MTGTLRLDSDRTNCSRMPARDHFASGPLCELVKQLAIHRQGFEFLDGRVRRPACIATADRHSVRCEDLDVDAVRTGRSGREQTAIGTRLLIAGLGLQLDRPVLGIGNTHHDRGIVQRLISGIPPVTASSTVPGDTWSAGRTSTSTRDGTSLTSPAQISVARPFPGRWHCPRRGKGPAQEITKQHGAGLPPAKPLSHQCGECLAAA